MFITNFFALLAIISVVGCESKSTNETISYSDILQVKIDNKTPNRYIADQIMVKDEATLKLITKEINNLKSIPEVGIKSNFGEYEMHIDLKDKSWRSYNIIYSTYDGVIILGSDRAGIYMNKYYKNDEIEKLILSLFIRNNENNKK